MDLKVEVSQLFALENRQDFEVKLSCRFGTKTRHKTKRTEQIRVQNDLKFTEPKITRVAAIGAKPLRVVDMMYPVQIMADF